MFEPKNLTTHPDLVRFEDASGMEYEVHGSHPRLDLAFEVAGSIESLRSDAERLLVDFMRYHGQFDLDFVVVSENSDEQGASVILRFSFIADENPHDFDYTYFDVAFAEAKPPQKRFWPIKFTVGFH